MPASIKKQPWKIDHFSTLDANQGQRVTLEVVEVYRNGKPSGTTTGPADWGPVVLMVSGQSLPAQSTFDEWATYLADKGAHVFIMNFQGFGGSTRPDVMDDPFNAKRDDLAKLRPSGTAGPPLVDDPYRYKRWLSDSDTEMAELWSVLNWLSTKETQKVNIIGYSAAAFLVGPSAMMWPQIVDRLFLGAPIFPPAGLGNASAAETFATAHPERFGFPLNIQSKHDTQKQFEDDQSIGAAPPGVASNWPTTLNPIWSGILTPTIGAPADEKAYDWGALVDGVLRYPTRLWWGWNEATVKTDTYLGDEIPVCIVYGESDSQAISRKTDSSGKLTIDPIIDAAWTMTPLHGGPPFSCTRLYDDIQGLNRKLMIRMPKTGHFMPWEHLNDVLFEYSWEWIDNGQIVDSSTASFKDGSFELDENTKKLSPVP